MRERWTTPAETANDSSDQDRPTLPPVTGPAFARRRATTAAWQALLVIDNGDDDGLIAEQIAATGEVIDALAKSSAAHTRKELRDAASSFERATRFHVRAARGHDRALRQAARDLVHSGPALGRGEDGATTAMLIDMAFFLAIAAANWHGKKHHAQQAEAARQAAKHLRAAYQAAAAQPIAVLRQRGRVLPQPLQHRHAAVLRQVVPDLAEQVLAEPGWPALAATLADTHAMRPRSGHPAHRSHPAPGTGQRNLGQRRPHLAPAPPRPPARRPRKRPRHTRPRQAQGPVLGAGTTREQGSERSHSSALITAIRQGTPPG